MLPVQSANCGVELLGEMNELTTVVRILKQYDVLHIQTDRPHLAVLIEVLQYKYHRDISVMRSACEYSSQLLVGLIQQVIVDD